jgi:hypothetical protein
VLADADRQRCQTRIMSSWSVRQRGLSVCTNKASQAASYSSLRVKPGAHLMLLHALLSTMRTFAICSFTAFLAAAEIAAVWAGPSSISSKASSARVCSLMRTISSHAL